MREFKDRMITVLIFGYILSSLFFFYYDYRKHLVSPQVNWSGHEVTYYTNIYSQKVSQVELGLREDGVAVWREIKLNDSKTSALFFMDTRVGRSISTNVIH